MQRLLKKIMVAGVALGLGWASTASAANFSFTGTLANPNQVQLFNFNIGATSDVTLVSYSYAGGVNANAQIIPRGGFDPILALFNSSGLLIGQNDDGGPANVPADAISGRNWDTFLFLANLAPGSYTASVAVYPNFANGPNLSNGFQGASTFNDVSGTPNNPRTADWAFDILNVNGASVVGVPAPAALALFGLGLLGLGLVRRKAA